MARFPDIINHWARPFIEGLAERNIVSGFPDGTFRPDKPTTRAQFAALITAIFRTSVNRPYDPFFDVSSRHWAASAIQKAYETGYLSGYPGKRFRPEASIARVEALVSLASGLGVDPDGVTVTQGNLDNIYQDAAKIPNYARKMVSAATYAGIVANYPNLIQLRPTEVATRADIAAFIYQALEYGGKAEPVESPYLVVYQRNTEVSHNREFRGVWLTTIWNRGWPSRKGMSVEEQQRELRQILDAIKSLNLNAVIWQVRPTGDAMYPTELEPWSDWLTGTQGEAPEPFYDPLEFMIDECHQRGLELHAWFNLYRVKVSSQAEPVSPHIAVTNPEVVYPYESYLWLDPGTKIVQDRAYEVIMDVVRRYDIDGIHFDDYCYPYGSGSREPFPDDKTYQAYLDDFVIDEPTEETNNTEESPQENPTEETNNTEEITQENPINETIENSIDPEEEIEEIPPENPDENSPQPLSLEDWRRDNINRTFERISQGIKDIKPYVKFGISPFGIYKSGVPEGIVGLSQYSNIFADPVKWLEAGWVDYLAPQLYWAIEPAAQSYPVLLQWWTQQNPQKKHIYIGNGLYKYETENWSVNEYIEQVKESRSLIEQLSLGNIFFDFGVFNRHPEIGEALQAEVYSQPSLVPQMEWLIDTPKPVNPARVKNRENKLSWELREELQNLRAWSVYRQDEEGWKLHNFLGKNITELTLPEGIYALCIVDRMGQESQGIVVTVKEINSRLK